MDLFDRVKKGDLDYIKTVTADVLLNARDEEGDSVLSAATVYNEFDCCKEILKKCPSLLYLQNNFKVTVLYYATFTGNYICLDYFLSVGLDAATNTNTNEEGKWIKVENKWIKLENSREENMLRFKNWIKVKIYEEDTALTLATENGNIHIVKRLIEVDREYKPGLSEIAGSKGKTALQWAVENQDHEMIKLLTDEGDPYSDYIPYSIAMDLFDHIEEEDLDYVKTVRSDILLKSRDERKHSALCIATIHNQLGCCEEILKRCPILLYHHDNAKKTVLHHATSFETGFYRLVDLFVGVGLDAATIEGNTKIKAENMQRFKNWINLQNKSKDTALTQAVNNSNYDIVKLFLQVDRQYKLGLSEITGMNKKTALQLALDNEDQEMIKLLTEGTAPDFEYVANTNGNMSLSIATTQAHGVLHSGNNSNSAGRKDVTDKANPSSESITRLFSQLASEKPQQYSHAQLKSFMTDTPVPIGSGGFGNVYIGRFPNGVPVAIKILKNTRMDLMEKQFKAEVSTMGKTYHRNLIKLYGYCYEANTKALIYEYMENGSLDKILFKKKLDLKWEKLYTIAIEIARGISYLHESCDPQIIHHDIKPANVLLDSNLSPKVIDFGLARLRLNQENSQFAQTDVRGTRGYVAPEITQVELGTISYRCDVYSYGMMLFDIVGSKRTNEDKRWLPGQVWEKFQAKQLGNFLRECGIKGNEDNISARLLSRVALMCSEHNPKNRPSMSTVVKILEGEVKPKTPVNPFPFYDSSSDNSTTWDSRN